MLRLLFKDVHVSEMGAIGGKRDRKGGGGREITDHYGSNTRGLLWWEAKSNITVIIGEQADAAVSDVNP